MFRKCRNLDERQLLERGNVFQHVCILLFVLLLANGLLRADGITWAAGMYEEMLILWAGLSLAFIEFIIREITPIGNAMKLFYVIIGIGGAFLGGMALVHHFYYGDSLVERGALTVLGGSLIEGGMMFVILLVFLCKSIYNHLQARKDSEEELSVDKSR